MTGCKNCGRPTSLGRRTCDECALAASLDLDRCYTDAQEEPRAWTFTLTLTLEAPARPGRPVLEAALRDLLDHGSDFLDFAEVVPAELEDPDAELEDPDGELRRAALDGRGRP